MDEHCSQTLALNQGSVETVRLRLTKAPNYPDAMFCAMRVQAPEGKKLLLRFREFNVQGSQDALCQDGDYLQLFDGPTEESPPIQGNAKHKQLFWTIYKCQTLIIKNIT
ncbi:hypothetical protein DPMN_177227 [Dreissena polymorpha]|uniref:CUB domain-containing protein n=1 Tax=Dreissena polymorpha TaxID=45954 RepID=A0A9D4IIU3_DREPO|nr:hypothetical protein DPMN_177227 [Dreissena polymorpha]